MKHSRHHGLAKAAALAVAAAVMMLGEGGMRPLEAQATTRRDLRDAEKLIRLVKALHPRLDDRLRIRAGLGSLSGTLPYAVELTLVEPRQSINEPERAAYSGWAKFDDAGNLTAYGTTESEGQRRLMKMRKESGEARLRTEQIQQLLAKNSAPYASAPSDFRAVPAVGVVLKAIGEVVSVGPPSFNPTKDAMPTDGLHWNPAVTWQTIVVAERASGRLRLHLEMDPWGDVVSVTPVP